MASSPAIVEPAVFTSEPRYIRRFSRTERALHWVHAAAFFVLLGSGLVLYLPSLSTAVGPRPLVKGIPSLTAVRPADAIALNTAARKQPAVLRSGRENEAL